MYSPYKAKIWADTHYQSLDESFTYMNAYWKVGKQHVPRHFVIERKLKLVEKNLRVNKLSSLDFKAAEVCDKVTCVHKLLYMLTPMSEKWGHVWDWGECLGHGKNGHEQRWRFRARQITCD